MGKVFFREQPNGYDKERVDNYIRKLMKAYQTVYSNYLEISEKQYGLKKTETQESNFKV